MHQTLAKAQAKANVVDESTKLFVEYLEVCHLELRQVNLASDLTSRCLHQCDVA